MGEEVAARSPLMTMQLSASRLSHRLETGSESSVPISLYAGIRNLSSSKRTTIYIRQRIEPLFPLFPSYNGEGGGGGKKSKVPALGVTTPFMNAYSTTACHGNLHPDNLYGTQVIIEHFPRSVGLA